MTVSEAIGAVQGLAFSREGASLCIRFARPEKRNALNRAMYGGLLAALQAAAVDPEIRCVCIVGTPDCFCSGNDLGDFVVAPESVGSVILPFLHALSVFPKPILAGVTGLAVGIGATMLLHCDWVGMAEGAYLHFPFVGMGLCVEGGASVLLPARIGALRAAEGVLLGQQITSVQALDWGLATRRVAAAELESVMWAAAAQLCAAPAEAVQASKRLLRAPMQAAVTQAIEQEAAAFSTLLQSPQTQALLMGKLRRS